ncbi:hypothetical protein BRD00_02185 [Halobacteriales archaeon QS_8_69_26]|nr:MAG: hypothetical protein BRD00_02185 [Halobacteriales archaeon QS_8_69_26]
MIERLRHATLFVLYQLTVLVGIVAMPVALALGRFGLTPPVHRAVDSLGEALEETRASTA